MSPTRVLLVHNRYRIPGGEERHIDLLMRWLPSASVDVRRFEVTSPATSSTLQRLRIGATLTYRPVGGRLLGEALSEFQPEVVHFHNIFPLLTPAGLRAARVHGARVVLTVHNYRFACPAGTLVRRGRIHEDCVDGSPFLCGLRNSRGVWSESIAYGIALELQRRLRLVHRWVDAYVAPSRFMARMLVRAGYPAARIRVVYHGTPIVDAPKEIGKFALFVGRLSSEKGIDTLIAASESAAAVPIVIVGDGPLAAMVEGAVGPSIRYLGRVTPDEVGRLRDESMFSVAPSSCYEGLPFGVLESMASGRPVVASDLGASAEIISDGVSGLLVPPNDSPALARAMVALFSDRTRTARMGADAWEAARTHFSAAEQASRLASLYNELRDRSASSN